MEILLRPLCIQDAVPLAKMADNENVYRYLRDRFPSPYLPEHALSFIQCCRENEEDGMRVFAHNKVHVDSRPYYNQTIRICCEIVKSNALFAYIRTIFINEEGKCIVTVLTELCAIDIVSFRFLRLTAINFPKVNQEIDTSYDFENIPYDESVTREVLPSMLDSSMHLNNVKSISMYFDTFSLEELDSFYAHSYDFIIKYNAQGKYNDTLTLAKGKRDNIYGYELKSADGKCIVTAQIVYH